MPRQLTRMLWRAPLLEIGRGGAHQLVQGADRFVDDTREGPRRQPIEISKPSSLGFTCSWTLEQHDVEAHARILPLKLGERFRHEADRHRSRDPDADMSFHLSR